MRGIQSLGDFNCKFKKGLKLDRRPVDPVFQRLAFEKFQRDEGLPVFFSNVVNGADVGMIESRCSLRLAFKTSQGLRIARNIFRQEFQRDKSAQPRVFGLVNDAHTAAAQLFEDTVMGNALVFH